MRIIGDVHGKTKKYLKVIGDAKYSLQIGDMGFNYDHLAVLDSAFHKFIPGNHDNYDKLPNHHSLMDYGIWMADVDIFYVRGAWSIDGPGCPWDPAKQGNKGRIQGLDWWQNEEVSVDGLSKAIELYENLKPELVVTHEAPIRIVNKLKEDGYLLSQFPVTRTSTSVALDIMFDLWKPKRWFFGHYHNNQSYLADGCEFRCINELNYVDI